jgi:hypothetical protein
LVARCLFVGFGAIPAGIVALGKALFAIGREHFFRARHVYQFIESPRMRIRRPLLLLLPLLAAVAGCPGPRPTAGTTGVEEGTQVPAWFEDVTARVKLDFVQDPGPAERPYFMPRQVGSGGAVFDFDGDGRLDLYLVQNGGPNGPKNRLFHQEPDGTFRDVSSGSGLDVAGWGMGVAVGDFDNDGKPDVLLTEYGRTRLFHNEGGGKFRDITKEAGIDNPQWGTAAAFFDYDRDGRLDLFIANYLDYDPSIKCGSGKPDFCNPSSYAGAASRLYHNLGPGPDGVTRFEDVTVKAGLGSALGKGLGLVVADFDGDGWPDVFVANDGMANFLWINKRDGTFAEQALQRNVAFIAGGQPAANMGTAWGDVDGDELFDLFVTHIADEMHTLWRQGPRGHFQDRTVAAGLTKASRSTGFGTALVDFDRDGRLDLAFVNGGVVRNRGAPADGPFWAAYAQRHQLFAGEAGGQFRDVSASNPAFCGTPAVGRSLIVADLDNDGAPDMIVTEIAGPARVLRNVAPAAGHWLAVRAVLPKLGGRDAYGAELTVVAGGKSYRRVIFTGYSYLCSNDPRAHFGLGPADRYDEIRIVWPDGTQERFPGGAADRQVTLKQGEGSPTK